MTESFTKQDAEMPALVLLHGFLGSAKDWTGVRQGLDGRVSTFAFDLPGHGSRTKCDDEDCTMGGGAHSVGNQLQIADLYGPVMYGYSMGGRLALYIAVKHAFYLPALILESTSAGLENGREERVAADEAWATRFETEPLRDVLKDWYSQPVFASPGDGDAHLSMVESRFRNDGRALARSLRGMSSGRQEPLWDKLHTVEMPVLLLAGEHDPKHIELMQRMAGLLPRAEMHVIARAGHNVHVDNPDGVCEVVLNFLKKTRPD